MFCQEMHQVVKRVQCKKHVMSNKQTEKSPTNYGVIVIFCSSVVDQDPDFSLFNVYRLDSF